MKENKSESFNNPFEYNCIENFVNDYNEEEKKNNLKLKNKIRELNPMITNFTLNSFFIYESILCDNFYDKLLNKNNMKPNHNQFTNLVLNFKKMKDNIEEKSKRPFVYMKKEFQDFFLRNNPIKVNLNVNAQNLKNLINDLGEGTLFSVRKLTNEYKNKFGIKISKTTIHKILKYDLKYHYLKTSPKNSIVLSKESIKRSFFVIKVISRIILLGGEIIYLDESAFYNYNSNLRTWRLKENYIYHNIRNNQKFNLLMAVSSKKVYGFQINEETTNSKTFQNFMDYLLKNMTQKEKENSVFFMDNLSSHKTLELFSFYKDNKLKILFNSPYVSEFNMIEYCFRFIKNLTYKKIYENISSLKKDVVEIIESQSFINSLQGLYKDTLLNYINFVEKNQNINLNV